MPSFPGRQVSAWHEEIAVVVVVVVFVVCFAFRCVLWCVHTVCWSYAEYTGCVQLVSGRQQRRSVYVSFKIPTDFPSSQHTKRYAYDVLCAGVFIYGVCPYLVIFCLRQTRAKERGERDINRNRDRERDKQKKRTRTRQTH